MIDTIIKRDGRSVPFEPSKIADAIEKAFKASGLNKDRSVADGLADQVVAKIEAGELTGTPTVEGVQDLVEEALIENGFVLMGADPNLVGGIKGIIFIVTVFITFARKKGQVIN